MIYATWFIAQGGVTGPIALGVNVKGYLTQRLVLLPKWLVGGGGWSGAGPGGGVIIQEGNFPGGKRSRGRGKCNRGEFPKDGYLEVVAPR